MYKILSSIARCLTSVSCLISLARPPALMQNSSDGSGHIRPGPDLRAKTFSLCRYPWVFHRCPLSDWKVRCFPSFFSVFFMKGC